MLLKCLQNFKNVCFKAFIILLITYHLKILKLLLYSLYFKKIKKYNKFYIHSYIILISFIYQDFIFKIIFNIMIINFIFIKKI